MSSTRFSIMIVDDAEENRFMLETILEDDFELSFAASGRECLDALNDKKPDLILLDVSMPDMCGLEVCKELKKGENSDIPIIFVSGLVSSKERLAGYEAGGDEYVTKPVDEKELHSKIKTSLDGLAVSKDLQVSADNAMNVAMEAMTSSSELGILNQFMRDCAQASSFQDLGHSLIEVTKHFGLNSCVQFRTKQGMINIDCNEDSLEARLLTKFKDGNKFTDFGSRTIVNSQKAGLLIKNMPVNDEAKYGRIKDHLAVLIDTVVAKVVSLDLAINIALERTQIVHRLVENNEVQFVDIREKITQRDEFTLQVMREVITGVEAQLFSLGLEEDQEKSLLKMMDDGMARIENLPDFTQEIESSFAKAKQALSDLQDK